jgi:hypothetical protein
VGRDDRDQRRLGALYLFWMPSRFAARDEENKRLTDLSPRELVVIVPVLAMCLSWASSDAIPHRMQPSIDRAGARMRLASTSRRRGWRARTVDDADRPGAREPLAGSTPGLVIAVTAMVVMLADVFGEGAGSRRSPSSIMALPSRRLGVLACVGR